MKKLISLIAIITLSLSSFSFANSTEKDPFNLGLQYYKQKDYTQAIKWYTKAAEQGDAMAQTILGLMYEKGQGVKQDYTQAVKWLTKAAKQENAWAQYNLAFMCAQRKGIKLSKNSSIKRSIYWMKKAARNGYKEAQDALTKYGIKY